MTERKKRLIVVTDTDLERQQVSFIGQILGLNPRLSDRQVYRALRHFHTDVLGQGEKEIKQRFPRVKYPKSWKE